MSRLIPPSLAAAAIAVAAFCASFASAGTDKLTLTVKPSVRVAAVGSPVTFTFTVTNVGLHSAGGTLGLGENALSTADSSFVSIRSDDPCTRTPGRYIIFQCSFFASGTCCDGPRTAVLTLTVRPTSPGLLRYSAYVEPGGIAAGVGHVRIVAGRPCRVPRLRGLTLAATRRTLVTAGCRLGKVSMRPSARVARGRVMSQSPAPATRLAPASAVNVVVSRGPRR